MCLGVIVNRRRWGKKKRKTTRLSAVAAPRVLMMKSKQLQKFKQLQKSLKPKKTLKTKTALNIKTASKNSKNDPKFRRAFYVEAARSRISSTSSNDEGISKTPKNTNKNFQMSKNLEVKKYEEKINSDSISSVESAFTSQHPLQFDVQQFYFEENAFRKRLFNKQVNNTTNNPTNNCNFPIKSYDHWMSIQINDIVLVEMNYESLQKGREDFNDFLDNCYDNDSISKLVVYFNKSASDCYPLKTTFFNHGFRSGFKW